MLTIPIQFVLQTLMLLKFKVESSIFFFVVQQYVFFLYYLSEGKEKENSYLLKNFKFLSPLCIQPS